MRFLLRTIDSCKIIIRQNWLPAVKQEQSSNAFFVLQQHLSPRRCYSNDTKASSPLGTLLSNSKEQVAANEEKKDEEEDSKKKKEQSWRKMKLTLMFFGVGFSGLGAYLVITLGTPPKDEDGNYMRDEYSDGSIVKAYLMRTLRELEYYRRLIKEPSREKLLPDPLKYPYIQPKYTLVLELTDVLVHPDWTYNTGWRFKKRPLLDYFLESLKDHYEIVIYTAEQGMTVFPLIEAIDRKNIIAYKLVRDATHFTGGHHVKSLNNLNRDLSKVICIDWNPNNVKFNPENLFRLPRWSGNDDDTTLLDLVSFLKAIAENDIEDVREVLKVYSDYDDPIMAFRDKQKRLIDELEAQEAAKKEQEKNKVSRWTPSFLKRSPSF
ncbi:mitochondrial import inner membrane translocase subunit TIM50-C-like [Anthonomus grandis grandis]|uniref:mitochondrial import inner membrane translocase subunit TIM50-C-like n=1 Tax=Anthonomus grandis grandis TaxID=2921223 RepID=UPI00216511E7|nr:mitochondrial import inner membrane translocase subunit TIM50-C-like [Anthonomus grandis grandis]